MTRRRQTVAITCLPCKNIFTETHSVMQMGGGLSVADYNQIQHFLCLLLHGLCKLNHSWVHSISLSPPASALYICIIIIDTVMIGVIMHADGAAHGCVDTVLTGWRGHISPTVSGGSSGYAQFSFRFDYRDARLMGVTSPPLHNLEIWSGQ